MKKSIVHILLACLLACPALASYTYVVDSYQYIPSLHGTESLLMIDQGGGDAITLWDNSTATILSTSPFKQGVGGIWAITLVDYSHLDFSGGELCILSVGNYATATLSGGNIFEIQSNQSAWKWQYFPEPPVLVPNPHITIVYSGDLPTLQTIYGLPHLVGMWGNGAGFSIYLPNITGYSPAIENIQFQLIPEPASLLLLSLGGLLLRRR